MHIIFYLLLFHSKYFFISELNMFLNKMPYKILQTYKHTELSFAFQPSLVAKLIVVDITPCSMKREDSGKFASFVSAINDLDLNSMGATLMAVKQQVDRSLSTIMPVVGCI